MTVGEAQYDNGNAKSVDNLIAEVLNFQMNATSRKTANVKLKDDTDPKGEPE